MMSKKEKKIEVTEQKGIYRVAADFRNGFNLVPAPDGNLKLIFWDEDRLKMYLKNFNLYPVITHCNN
jgi:hypothetical protein